MATQLRLVDPPPPAPTRTKAAASARTSTGKPARAKPARAKVAARGIRSPRRATQWGEWQLDARTRKIGREGIAAARHALEAASSDSLPRAS